MENQFSYGSVFVFSKNYIILTGRIEEYEEKNKMHDVLMFYVNDKWNCSVFPNVFTAILMLRSHGHEALALSGDGLVRVMDASGISNEFVDQSEDGPNSLRWLLDMKEIGQAVYACGMNRQVYRRRGSGQWERLDHDIRSGDVVGLKAIDGFNENEICAVGFHGEIWWFDGRKWTREDSPTNNKLECVVAASDGYFYAAGGMGTVLKGKKDSWKIVSNDVTEDTFWAMTDFQNRIYLSSYEGIFYVTEQDEIEKLDFNLDKDITTCRIHAADGVMWSVGRDDLLYTDGTHWKEVQGPTK